MKRLLLLVVCCAAAFGQFSSLATPGDGSVVYFSTPLRLKNSQQNTAGKIFVADESGVRLVEQRDQTWSPPTAPPRTNFYWLLGLSLSDDGAVRAVSARRDCQGGSSCITVVKYEGTVTGQPATPTTDGPAYLSADGRYALVGNNGTFGPAHLVNLVSGVSTAVADLGYQQLPYGRRVVSSNGWAVFPSSGKLELFSAQDMRLLATSAQPEEVVIDSAARRVVYTGGGQAAIVDVATGAEEVIGLASHISTPAISADGSTVTFIAEGQVWIYRGGDTTRLTSDPSAVVDAVLSGDGRVVYAATATGRLIKVSTATGESKTLIARTPFVASYPVGVAGSLSHIVGAGFREGNNAVEVVIDGDAMPIVNVTATDIAFQVPWWMAQDGHVITVETHADSPFQLESGSMFVQAPVATFLMSGSSALVVHEDWSGLVTLANPARAGEVVHLYATGLGDVRPALGDGEPGGSNPPSVTLTKVTCTVVPNLIAEVLWSGIAPGMVGVYQVDVRIPAGTKPLGGWINASCGVPTGFGSVAIAVGY